MVMIDQSNGKFAEHHVLFDVPECTEPLKIRRQQKPSRVAVTHVSESDPRLFVAPAAPDATPSSVVLPSVPDEIRLTSSLAVISCDKDEIAFVNLETIQLHQVDELDKLLKPAANGPEDVHLGPDHESAVVSLQKDSGKGKKQGNRLLVYELVPQSKLIADLQLPRDRPELHIAGNLEQQGPGPEVVLISEPTNTLAVTLDLYGGVALMNWGAARSGQLEDYHVLPTSLDGSWGESFPDRAILFELNGRDFYLVSNAGSDGGSVLIDLKSREIVWRRPTPPGLEAAVFVPALRQAFTVVSGKVKWRAAGDVQKEFRPRAELLIFDFQSSDAVRNQPVASVALPGLPTQITLASESPLRLLIAVGQEAQRATDLVLVDPETRQIVDQRAAAGTIGRFEK
jgi:hypothetical protein